MLRRTTLALRASGPRLTVSLMWMDLSSSCQKKGPEDIPQRQKIQRCTPQRPTNREQQGAGFIGSYTCPEELLGRLLLQHRRRAQVVRDGLLRRTRDPGR